MKRLPLTVSVFWLFAWILFPVWAAAQEPADSEQDQEKSLPTISEKVAKLDKREGFFDSYWDSKTGSMYLQIDDLNREFLYVNSLATGLGSNPVGLDRGKLGRHRVVHFRRVGPKVLMIQPNLRFRALTDNAEERRAVEQSFAQSVIWGGTVVAEENDSLLVDITSLLMRDEQGVTRTLATSDQGDYSLDKNRSALFLPACKSFPSNVEFEATLTFVGRRPGSHVRQTVPTPQAVTLRQHHSFIELPDDEYRPRRFDVRAPSMSITFADYASPIDSPLQRKWILRHRLVKQDPAAELSEPVKPIIYYVDRGAPAQIRDALITGASWWNEAFEAAGFKNAFQVKVLPPAADPMDVRYNVIQWVHRSTRGWSYGGSVVDPRTGEILKGHVTLGSLRVRQDHLLMESLPAEVADGDPNSAYQGCACCGIGMRAHDVAVAQLAPDPVAIALSRIRQLSAHEVGHTLGFVHNFAASTYGGRASVMDYPAPLITVDGQNQLDFSNAYAVGIGDWDKLSVRYAYTQFADGVDENKELDRMLRQAAERKMIFISDADARPAHAAHAMGNLWDNGTDPISEFKQVMRVRRIALEQFDTSRLPGGMVSADVEQYLVPVFLYHRYQLQAIGKLIGGVDFSYGPVSADNTQVRAVSKERQLAALMAILSTLDPAELRLPPSLVRKIGVKPYQQLRDQEQFSGQTGRVFDRFAPARVAIKLALDEMLQPQRLARLETQASQKQSVSASELLFSLVNHLWRPVDKEMDDEAIRISQIARAQLLERLMQLADNPQASVHVRAAATSAVESHQQFMGREFQPPGKMFSETAFLKLIERKLGQFRARSVPATDSPRRATVPPGSPIGS